MSRTTSATFKQAAFAQETAEAVIVLIQIDHPTLSDPIRLSSDGADTIHNGDTYVSYPFNLSLPDDPQEGLTKGQLTVDNVGRDIVPWLRAMASAPTVTIKVVLASDPDTVEAEFTNFELTNVSYDAQTITGDLGITTFMNEPYPGGSFLPSQYPGLF